MNYLGEYLKNKIKEMKVSEREISAKCGISHSYLNQLIKGINPSTKKRISPTLMTFEKLSSGFGISIDSLQKIARGLDCKDEALTVDNTININKFLKIGNKNISPVLLKQIHEFQNFMSVIDSDNRHRTEEELCDFICELKSVIKKHLNNHK